MIETIEEMSMNAWPALETIVSDGWVLRFSSGYTRRANSVHPLDGGTGTLVEKIGEAERLYRERGLPPIFKLTSQSLPDGLEKTLAERGYSEEARTSVRIAPVAASKPDEIRIETSWEKSKAWRTAFHRMGDVVIERRALHDRILASIPLPKAFASIEHDGHIVGCALGVLQGGWLGIFDVVVDPMTRRQGHGERLMSGLMAWGCERGARQTYLQVTLDNAPALALYDRLGFREVYPYWYRVKR